MKNRRTLLAIISGLIFLGTYQQSHAAAGDLDASFGTNGVVNIEPVPTKGAYAADLAIQADGKIIMVGTVKNLSFTKDDFFIARFYPNGTLDGGFGSGGIVVTDIGVLGIEGGNSIDVAAAVGIQTDGKIVVAGTVYNPNTSDNFALVRYNTDGTLDTTFGPNSNGRVVTDLKLGKMDYVKDMTIQSDNKIIVVGYTYVGNYTDFAVLRYTTTGSLDTSFDGDGIAKTSFGTNSQDYGRAVAIQADGKIVVSGDKGNGTNQDFAVVRYNKNGSLDSSFDGDGKASFSFGTKADAATGVAIQSDGKIILGGYANSNLVGGPTDIAVARLTIAGKLDTSFDSDGKLTTVFLGSQEGYDVNIQADGKIIAVGMARDAEGNIDSAVVRYLVNGTLDASFSGDGKVTTDIGTHQRVKIDGNGNIVSVGYGSTMTRYLGQ